MAGRGQATERKLDMALDDLVTCERDQRDDRKERGQDDRNREGMDSYGPARPRSDDRLGPYAGRDMKKGGNGKGRRRLPPEDKALLNTCVFFNSGGEFVVRLHDTEVVVVKKQLQGDQPSEASGVLATAKGTPSVDDPLEFRSAKDEPPAKLLKREATASEVQSTQASSDEVSKERVEEAELAVADGAAPSASPPTITVSGSVSAPPSDADKQLALAPEGIAIAAAATANKGEGEPSSESALGDTSAAEAATAVKIDDKGTPCASDAAEATEPKELLQQPSVDASTEQIDATTVQENKAEVPDVDEKKATEALVVKLTSGSFRTLETKYILNEALQTLALRVSETGDPQSGWTVVGESLSRRFEDGMQLTVSRPYGQLEAVQRHLESKIEEAKARDEQRSEVGLQRHGHGHAKGDSFDGRGPLPTHNRPPEWSTHPPPGWYPHHGPPPPHGARGPPPFGWHGTPARWGGPPPWELGQHHRPPHMHFGAGARPLAHSRGPLPDSYFQ